MPSRQLWITAPIALAVWAGSAFAAGEASVLRPGETMRLEMPPGDPEKTSVTLELVATEDGPLTIETSTLYFDTLLRVFEPDAGETAKPIAEDDDEGTAENSRLTFEAAAGRSYRIAVRSSMDDWGGPFEVSALPGAPTALDIDHRERDVSYWDAVAAEGERTGNAILEARALFGQGSLNHEAGEYAKARRLLGEASERLSRALGPEHRRSVDALNMLALTLQAMGEYAAARRLFERALATREKVHGPDHAETALGLNNLALLLQAMGEYAAARPLFERALAINEKVHGPEHPYTALGLNNLAQLLQSMGEYAAARPLLERALAIHEKVHGHEHRYTALSLHSLASLLQAMGEYAAARPLYELALATVERMLGAEHPDTATILHSLAGLLQATGEYGAARPLYERALAIYEKIHPDHPYTAQGLAGLAGLLQDMGEYGVARPLYERALAIYEKMHGPDHPYTAQGLAGLAGLLQSMGEYGVARPLFERALAIREKVHGPEHPDTATILHSLAGLLQATGEYAAARPLYERALAIREKMHGPDHPYTAQGLNNLSGLLQAMGEYAAARPLFERALAIREKVHGPEHPDTAQGLNNLARLIQATGEYAAARPLYERSLAIFEKVRGLEHPDTAASLNNLAGLLQAMGEYAAARRLYERALAIREKVHGPEHPETALGLNNLASLLQAMGEYAAARPLFERALAINEKVHGPEHPDTAASLNNLAGLLQAMGEYAAARPLYERALATFEKVHGPEHPYTALGLNNLALLLQAMGEYAAARPLFERALAINEKVHGPEHPYTALGLNNLAGLLQDIGEYAAARPLKERALAIFEKVHGLEHPYTAQGLNNLARLLQAMGEYAAARPLYERALAIYERAHGPEHPETATALRNLAVLLQDMGEYAAARPLSERVLAIREKALGPDHPDTGKILAGLGTLYLALEEAGPAMEAALRAESIGTAHLSKTAWAMSEEAALGYAAVRARGLDLALTVLVGSGDKVAGTTGRVWEAVAASRGLVLDEVASRHRRMTATVRLAQELGQSSEALARLMVRGASGGEIEQARRRKERAERELGRATQPAAAASSPPGLAAVGLGLPPDGALVAFVRYKRLRPGEAAPGKNKAAKGTSKVEPKATASYLALVLRKGVREPAVVSLGEAEPIDALVEDWKREASSGAARESGEAAYRVAGDALRRAVWDPLADALEGARRLFVVPDGALHLVSFAALPVGESSWLIESGPWIHYLSAERDLLPGPGGAPASNAGLLAVGGPSFDSAGGTVHGALVASTGALGGSRSASVAFRGLRFEPLPGAAAEAAEIVRLWREREAPSYVQATAPMAQVESAVLLEGAAASETAFKEQAPGHRVLHLATHGFFFGGAGEPGRESSRGIGALAEPLLPKPRAAPPSVAKVENPLLLSGLALAGANQREQAGEGEDDGILTAEEIASLDLAGTEWAVLSACDTGVGDVRAGEGVFGLRRAFRVAGAGTLIMSLWSVDDEATREWMTALYDAWLNRRMGTAEAVREAGLSVLRARRAAGASTHPFYWAAFVAAGDWK